MIPVSLKLSNFTSYSENVPELDFTKFHLAAISGPNGAGKSSLLDAITWCVWGWSRAGDNADQLVRLGALDMFVEFSFELDGHIYTIKRRRAIKSGSSALELWSNSHNLTEGTIKSTQQKIINTLHLSFETFSNSAFLRQGHADEFTTKGPSDRKRILADILGLFHYDELEEKAKEKIKEIQNKLQLLKYQLLEIDTELSQKESQEEKRKETILQVEKIEEEIKSKEANLKTLQVERETLNVAEQQREKLLQNLTQNQQELREITEQGVERKKKIDSLQTEISNLKVDEKLLTNLSDLQKEKENFEKIKQEQLELKNQLTKTQSVIDLKNAELKNLQKQLDEIEEKLADLKRAGAKCPTCGQEMNTQHKKTAGDNLLVEKKELTEKMALIDKTAEEKAVVDLTKKITELVFDNQKYQQLTAQLTDLVALQEQKEKLIQLTATLETEQKTLVELRSFFVNKKSQVDKLEIEFKSLLDVSGKLTPLNLELQQTEEQLNNLRAEEKELRGILGQITELISRSAQLEKLQKEKSSEKQDLEKQKTIFEELALAFGKKGIQAMIIETAIPEIEDEANRLLDKLSEGRMKIALITQKETKTKMAGGERGIVETLDIVISDEMGERPYELYSGGEAFRVNITLRLALSKLLTRRAGAKLQFLVIDEGFGTQDAQGRTRIVEVIDAIKDDFEKIVVITHLEELKEEFPVRIEVSKNSGGSTFELIGD
ncbi:MAG: SMC family ATPase [Candidatus Daviesbacteria bacterium]|nr:MAG: SMC family ATPase [Candidatus Daviesbacteria bacterium]